VVGRPRDERHERLTIMKSWFGDIFGGSGESGSTAAAAATRAVEPRSVPAKARYGGQQVRQNNVDVLLGLAGGEWAPGQEVLDDYVVKGTLGEGGMGKVYLLRSRSTGSRFAVKRAKGLSEADRRNFLAELQTWIDLPEHANLVPCRFFRSLGDEVLIFAEYVEGGSLREWIESRRLYTGRAPALERMLDVAIQFAWGLHCLHGLGLVHQDVKPGNVLMGTDGREGVRPRVTDYGLVRARAAAAAGEAFSNASDPSRSILVSSGGGTPAYWSPEQAAGLPVTRRTDIWSWGVSVLEMFTGEVSWRSGQGAGEVLEQYLGQGGRDEEIPLMPGGVADILRQCFRQDPRERPANLGEVVERLKGIYEEQEVIGTRYPGALDEIERAAWRRSGGNRIPQFHAGCAVMLLPESAAQEWLQKALLIAGCDPAEAAKMMERRGVTRKGKLVAEIAAYEEAKQLYVRLIRDGRKDLESELARLCSDKALVHDTAGDVHGALHEDDQALSILERLVKQDGRSELANDLAITYQNKAVAVSNLGDKCWAVTLYDQAIAIRERLVNQEGRGELANNLANTYLNKATAISALGDNRGALALYDRALAIQERLVNQEGHRELANDLARTYQNKANSVSALGDKCGALGFYDQALAIRERLVNQEGRGELANDLARTYVNKARAVSDLGNKLQAVDLYDQAIAIRERLVNQDGRRELASGLASTYLNKAKSLGDLGDNRRALALCDRAIAILEPLVSQEGRPELLGDFAQARAYRAGSLIALGKRENGLQEMRSAQRILQDEIARTGRLDLKQALEWVNQQLAQHST